MTKKKVLLIAAAMILVCALSVAGTLALLAETGGSVTNTFVASTTPDDFVKTFEIKEYTITDDGKGGYTSTTTEGAGNDYTVLPGTTLPKHAFVRLDRTSTAPAYMFIEVVGTLDETAYTWSVDSANWTNLNIAGPNGGALYVYGTTTAGTVLKAVDNQTYDILTNDSITVKDVTDLKISTDAQNPTELEFYAYVCQATVAKDGVNTSDPATVFDVCF